MTTTTTTAPTTTPLDQMVRACSAFKSFADLEKAITSHDWTPTLLPSEDAEVMGAVLTVRQALKAKKLPVWPETFDEEIAFEKVQREARRKARLAKKLKRLFTADWGFRNRVIVRVVPGRPGKTLRTQESRGDVFVSRWVPHRKEWTSTRYPMWRSGLEPATERDARKNKFT